MAGSGSEAYHYREEFPGCCGIGIITDLDSATKGSIQDELNYLRDDRRGGAFATINNYQQKKGIGKILRACGFSQLPSFRNPNTGSMIYVFFKKLTKKKVRPRSA